MLPCARLALSVGSSFKGQEGRYFLGPSDTLLRGVLGEVQSSIAEVLRGAAGVDAFVVNHTLHAQKATVARRLEEPVLRLCAPVPGRAMRRARNAGVASIARHRGVCAGQAVAQCGLQSN